MNKIVWVLSASLLVSVLVLFYLHFFDAPQRLAYVRSQDLIYKFSGTQEAQSRYNIKKEQWQANVDTLDNDFQKMVSKYNLEYANLTPELRKEREKALSDQQQQLVQYRKAIEEKARVSDEEMMQGVLNQVNTFVEEYGQANGYDIILGTTLSGNVLYGNSTLDITDELLEDLNKHYRGTN